MFDHQNTAAQSLAGAQSMITASKRGLWIGKLPESEDALYPCGYFLLGYGPVRCCPSGPCGALSQEKGRMPTGVPRPHGSERGQRDRLFCIGGRWPFPRHSLSHLLGLVVSGQPQAVGQRGTRHRECVPLTTWSPSPHTPTLVWAALTVAPTKQCHILAEAPWAGPQRLAMRRSDRQPLRSVYQRTRSPTIPRNSLLWSIVSRTGSTWGLTAHLENSP